MKKQTEDIAINLNDLFSDAKNCISLIKDIDIKNFAELVLGEFVVDSDNIFINISIKILGYYIYDQLIQDKLLKEDDILKVTKLIKQMLDCSNRQDWSSDYKETRKKDYYKDINWIIYDRLESMLGRANKMQLSVEGEVDDKVFKDLYKTICNKFKYKLKSDYKYTLIVNIRVSEYSIYDYSEIALKKALKEFVIKELNNNNSIEGNIFDEVVIAILVTNYKYTASGEIPKYKFYHISNINNYWQLKENVLTDGYSYILG